MGGLQAFQFYIKQRMEASLENSALTTISIPAAEVNWYEEGREIMIQGQMFDIKTFVIRDGIFTAQGVYDEDETEVVNLMNGHWSDKEQTVFLIRLLLLSHCLILLTFFFYSFRLIAFIQKMQFLFTFRYPSPYLAITIPPPKAYLIFQ
jgi:hypothetical protein